MYSRSRYTTYSNTLDSTKSLINPETKLGAIKQKTLDIVKGIATGALTIAAALIIVIVSTSGFDDVSSFDNFKINTPLKNIVESLSTIGTVPESTFNQIPTTRPLITNNITPVVRNPTTIVQSTGVWDFPIKSRPTLTDSELSGTVVAANSSNTLIYTPQIIPVNAITTKTIVWTLKPSNTPISTEVSSINTATPENTIEEETVISTHTPQVTLINTAVMTPVEVINTSTPESTATSTLISQTNTPILENTQTNTSVPNNTPVPNDTATLTPVPENTTIIIQTLTWTPLPPSVTTTNTIDWNATPSTPTFTPISINTLTPTLTNTLEPSVTPTSTPELTFTPIVALTPTSTETSAPSPSMTFTKAPTFTNIFTPTPTNTSTFTATSVPNTPTPTLTPTFTLIPTATFTLVLPTATNTLVPPTPIDTPTFTPIPPTFTNTPIPPTSTFTPIPPTANIQCSPLEYSAGITGINFFVTFNEGVTGVEVTDFNISGAVPNLVQPHILDPTKWYFLVTTPISGQDIILFLQANSVQSIATGAGNLQSNTCTVIWVEPTPTFTPIPPTATNTPISPTPTFTPCLPGSPSCPFTAFTQSQGSPVGIYWFTINGRDIELYAAGTGYVLLRAAAGTGITQPIVSPPVVILPGDNAQYDQATVVDAANLANNIRITAPTYPGEVSTFNAYEMGRLRAYMSLNRNVAVYNGADWISNIGHITHTCLPDALLHLFSESVYWACGNSNGLHWIEHTVSTWVHIDGDTQLLLWVK